MPKTIRPQDLGNAIADQLAIYGEEKIEEVNAAGERAVKKLVSFYTRPKPACFSTSLLCPFLP